MNRIDGSTDYVIDVLQQLFQGHGIEARAQSGVVSFPAHPGLWADGELFSYSEKIVQLDVRLGGFDGDRVLVESIGGFGSDLNSQANFALEAFANASFHVLLPAFFNRPPCHGIEREVWTIGSPRVVYPGLITTVFGFPPPTPDGMPDLGFYEAFTKLVESYPLPRGTHWIRVYQMRNQGQALSNEVLVDNDECKELQAALADYNWPVSDSPYDVRVFVVVKDLL